MQSATAYLNEGIKNLNKENYSAALTAFDAALKIEANHLQSLEQRVKAKIHLNDTKGAIKDISQLSDTYP